MTDTRNLRAGVAARCLMASAGLLAGGCGSSTPTSTPDGSFLGCMGDIHADDYTAGMVKPGMNGKLSVQLMTSDPGPPIKGTNSWSVLVKDSSGAPVDGASIVVFPFMPYHNHGTQVQAVVTPMMNGTYGITPLYFFMAGLWQTTLTVNTADGMTSDSVAFSFCISD